MLSAAQTLVDFVCHWTQFGNFSSRVCPDKLLWSCLCSSADVALKQAKLSVAQQHRLILPKVTFREFQLRKPMDCLCRSLERVWYSLVQIKMPLKETTEGQYNVTVHCAETMKYNLSHKLGYAHLSIGLNYNESCTKRYHIQNTVHVGVTTKSGLQSFLERKKCAQKYNLGFDKRSLLVNKHLKSVEKERGKLIYNRII